MKLLDKKLEHILTVGISSFFLWLFWVFMPVLYKLGWRKLLLQGGEGTDFLYLYYIGSMVHMWHFFLIFSVGCISYAVLSTIKSAKKCIVIFLCIFFALLILFCFTSYVENQVVGIARNIEMFD